jgi:YaiO family outer membrane protein
VRLRAAALALVAALGATPAAAPAQGTDSAALPDARQAVSQVRNTEIETGFTRDHLSGGRQEWQSWYLEGAHDFARRHTLFGGLGQTDRFGLRDDVLWAGLYYPLAREWTLLVEASHSPDHQVLARYSAFGQLHVALPHGWGLAAGLRHSEYTSVYTNTLLAEVERYWGNWRGAYTLYLGRPEDAGSAPAHRLQANYYYGERSRVGAAFTFGREVENTGPPSGIITTDVMSFAVFGRHWFAPQWAATWEVLTHEQGNLYRRTGLRLGLRYGF